MAQKSLKNYGEIDIKKDILTFKLKNLIKSHAKQFAVLIKILLKNDPKKKNQN